MFRTNAIIRKVGDQYCVFSEDGTKKLGCSPTLEGAQHRLKQVDYFKHKGSSSMEFNFDNFAKAVNGNIDPKEVGKAPEGTPSKIVHQSLSDKLKFGSIAGQPSAKLLDTKEHFPVITISQAQSSLARVLSLREVPVWYNGTLNELQSEVRAGISKLHPSTKLSIALSDGQTPSETTKQSVKDPEDDRKEDLVPQVERPSLSISKAECLEKLSDPNVRKSFAGRLMEIIDAQMNDMKNAKKIAQSLLDEGISSDQFDILSTYVQQNVLSELMMSASTATVAQEEDRRATLLKRMNPNG